MSNHSYYYMICRRTLGSVSKCSGRLRRVPMQIAFGKRLQSASAYTANSVSMQSANKQCC